MIDWNNWIKTTKSSQIFISKHHVLLVMFLEESLVMILSHHIFPNIPKYQISIKITKCRQHPGDLAINHILLSSLSPIPQTLDNVPIQVFLSATSFYPGEWVSRFCGLTACWIALWIIILSEGRNTRRSLKIRKIQDLIKEQLKGQKMLSWIMMMIMLITTRSGSRRVVPPHKSGSGEECLATQPQASQQYHHCHQHHHHHL